MKKLIFDLGCHNLDSTYNFLKEGYIIVAVDADINKLRQVYNLFNEYVYSGQLILINKAIYSEENIIIDFYIQPNETVWNSLYKNISEREHESYNIKVKTTTLYNLIELYGNPEYCKIDIEGADILALESLRDELPKYISCETECLGVGDIPEPLKVLNKLYELGYTKFYLEDQSHRNRNKLKFNQINEWMSYEQVKELLITTRNSHSFELFYDFWYDIYATL